MSLLPNTIDSLEAAATTDRKLCIFSFIIIVLAIRQCKVCSMSFNVDHS